MLTLCSKKGSDSKSQDHIGGSTKVDNIEPVIASRILVSPSHHVVGFRAAGGERLDWGTRSRGPWPVSGDFDVVEGGEATLSH